MYIYIYTFQFHIWIHQEKPKDQRSRRNTFSDHHYIANTFPSQDISSGLEQVLHCAAQQRRLSLARFALRLGAEVPWANSTENPRGNANPPRKLGDGFKYVFFPNMGKWSNLTNGFFKWVETTNYEHIWRFYSTCVCCFRWFFLTSAMGFIINKG